MLRRVRHRRGAARLVERGPPWIRRMGILVPYTAVVSAGAANLFATRMPEIRSGAPVFSLEGDSLGASSRAAVESTKQVLMSRIMLLPVMPMLAPPLAMGMLRRAVPLFSSSRAAAVTAEVGLIASTIYCCLPAAIAVFLGSRDSDGAARAPRLSTANKRADGQAHRVRHPQQGPLRVAYGGRSEWRGPISGCTHSSCMSIMSCESGEIGRSERPDSKITILGSFGIQRSLMSWAHIGLGATQRLSVSLFVLSACLSHKGGIRVKRTR